MIYFLYLYILQILLLCSFGNMNIIYFCLPKLLFQNLLFLFFLFYFGHFLFLYLNNFLNRNILLFLIGNILLLMLLNHLNHCLKIELKILLNFDIYFLLLFHFLDFDFFLYFVHLRLNSYSLIYYIFLSKEFDEIYFEL